MSSARETTKKKTSAESLYHFMRIPSGYKYAHLKSQAEEWLHRFCRHNEPSRSEIVVVNKVVKVALSPPEMALYCEMDHALRGIDATAMLRRGRNVSGGVHRTKRLREMIQGCEDLQTATEVLMHTASFTKNALQDPEQLVNSVTEHRASLVRGAMDEFATKLRDIWWAQQKYDKLLQNHSDYNPVQDFHRFCKRVKNGSAQIDSDIDPKIKAVLDKAEKEPKRDDDLWKKLNQNKEDDTKNELDALEMRIKTGVNSMNGLGSLHAEIESRHRTRRFFAVVGDCLLNPRDARRCDVTGRQIQPKAAIVLPCGHCFCGGKREEIVKTACCPVDGCGQQNVTADDVLLLEHLLDANGKDFASGVGFCGSKLAVVRHSLLSILEEDDTNRVLVFCQLAPLMEKVKTSLAADGVNFLTLDGSPESMHTTMQHFKEAKGADPRVLLLALDERCAGTNLTAANHIFFLHPVLRDGSRSPADIETQAIGRARRYGQSRTVTVRRFVAQMTREVELEADNALERQK